MDCVGRRTRSSKFPHNRKPPPPPATAPAASIIVIDEDDADVVEDCRGAEEAQPTAVLISDSPIKDFSTGSCSVAGKRSRGRTEHNLGSPSTKLEFDTNGESREDSGRKFKIAPSVGRRTRCSKFLLDRKPPPAASIIVVDEDDADVGRGAEEAQPTAVLISDSPINDFTTGSCSVAGKRSRGKTEHTVGSPSTKLEFDTNGESRAHVVISCVAKRTRLQIGVLPRFSYTEFFKRRVFDEDGGEDLHYEQRNRGGSRLQGQDFVNNLAKKVKKTEEDLNEHGNEISLMPFSSDSDEEGVGKPRVKNQSINGDDQKDISRLHELLLESVSQEKDLSINRDGDEDNEEDYPLLFSFDDGAAKTMEKTEYDGDLDELWSELDFALQSISVGEYGDCELQEDIHCSGGDHQFVLDEQIGIICKLCFFVHLEIKYVLPSLAKNRANSSSANNSSAAATKDRQFSLTFGDVFAQMKNESSRRNCEYVATGTVWDHIPGVDQTLYAHQREAFEFMWRNLAGSIRLQELKDCAPSNAAGGGGCIISHAPGTGKSRLAIVFVQSFLKQFPDCRPVIIAPRGMLLTWEKEFKRWKVDLAFHNLNTRDFSGDEGELALKEPRVDRWVRLGKLCSWKRGNGVLALSYNLFTKLITGTHAKNSEGYIAGQILLNQPGLIVFDEGHTPRNDRSLVWKAIERVETLNRIGLSGTPFQNNLRELSNTMRLVRPGLGKLLANILNPFHSMEKKKKNNVVDDAKIAEIKSAIKPFVHVHGGAILDTLPGLRECLILLNPPERQRIVLDNLNNKSGLDVYAEHKLSMASIHPSLLACVRLTENERSAVDVDLLRRLKSSPDEGVKTRFVVELVRLSEALNEKVLVFCQYVEPLAMLRKQLMNVFKWSDGTRVLQMDGSIPAKSRQSLIDVFNDPASGARILLASTKACGEGISLVGASRIVLLDVLWNPSVERQAISRAYRIGQVRFVYTYQLILNGTGEREKYKKQVGKDQLSEMLFSMENDDAKSAVSSKCTKERAAKFISDDKILEEMIGNHELKDMFIKLHFPVKKSSDLAVFGEDAADAADGEDR